MRRKIFRVDGIKGVGFEPVTTPSLSDHQIPAGEFEAKGKLSDVCARIALKILLFTRIARPDVLGACNVLSREVSRWTPACDRRLLRLVSYIHCTKNYAIKCMVGNYIDDLKLAVYSDASFAGDLIKSHSTTGGYICLVGPNTYVPLQWICKKQGSVSESSTEAEVVALDNLIRLEGLPCLNLIQQCVDCLEGNFAKHPFRKELKHGRKCL